jgi:type II secretory pathway pseudopilin PulG
MADEKSGKVAIVVAVIGVAGAIGAAALTSGRTFDQKFADVTTQTAQISKDIDEAREDLKKLRSDTSALQQAVATTVNAAARCATKVHEVVGRSPLTIPATGGDGAVWVDYPELRLRFTLSERRAVAISYQLTDVVEAVPGGFIVARLKLDNEIVPGTQILTGQADRYRTAQSFWAGILEAGTHVAKVEYRSPFTGSSKPLEADFAARALYVVELGCPAP